VSAGLSLIHRHEPGTDSIVPALLLLHGTGADENDLIGLGRRVAPTATLISPRGPVKEGAANRWFRRLAEGVFDEPDLISRACDLAAFIREAMTVYGLAQPPVALGFSNGANIAAGLLYLHPDALSGAILLRAMKPLAATTPQPLAGKPVLLLSGRSDPFAPARSRDGLAADLMQAGATVDARITGEGHGLVQEDVTAMQGWWAAQASRRARSA
jgi:phospholipase/carboxylesterase